MTTQPPRTRYLHTMIRVHDLDKTISFFRDLLGLQEINRITNNPGGFTLVFMAAPGQHDTPIELTYNHNSTENYSHGRSFGHLAFEVSDIYAVCEKIMAAGVTINRPPRDGHMAFIKTPDGISIELLNEGGPKTPKEPWASMENTGSW